MEEQMEHSTRIFLPWNDTDFQNMSSKIQNNSRLANRTTSNSANAIFYPIIVAEMILSIICLILSIIVCCILPEFKNVHGKSLISLSSCLLTTFVLLCLDTVLHLHISYTFCFTIAITIHVTFLATFFWTNVMAHGIWRSITSMKVKSRTMRYFKSSIYTWTAAILTALPAIILESTELVPLAYRPQFGVKRCWLSGKTAVIYYFYFPVGVILLSNLIMFIMAIWGLWKFKKMTEIIQIRNTSPGVKQQQERLNRNLKLFLVMGIIWFTEFLPWVTRIYKLYVLADMLTALLGILLFAIIVLKKRILRQIWEKLSGKIRKKSFNQQTMSSSGQQLSNFIQGSPKA